MPDGMNDEELEAMVDALAERIADRLGLELKPTEKEAENLRAQLAAKTAMSHPQLDRMDPATLREIANSFGIQAHAADVPTPPRLVTASAKSGRLGVDAD